MTTQAHILTDTTHTVRGAESMHLSGVCLSVPAWARQTDMLPSQ